jgi:hypothetical protein
MKIQGMKRGKYNQSRVKAGKRPILETDHEDDILISQGSGSHERSSRLSSTMQQAMYKKHGATLTLPKISKHTESNSKRSSILASFNDRRQSVRIETNRDKERRELREKI